MSFPDILKKLQSNADLDENDLLSIFSYFEEKKLNDEDIKKLVLVWRKKKETPDEIFHLASIVNKKQGQRSVSLNAIDICGTGGDKTNTFNISTLTAIVASSCGLEVIKHSGRSTTGISGSVDILSELDYEFNSDYELQESCFKKYKLMFVSSKLLRETFGDVKKNCKEINIPGFVNLLGPLTNPYFTSYHLLGVSNPEWGNLLADTLKYFKDKNALIVCSKTQSGNYLDELSFCGENCIWEVSKQVVKKSVISESLLLKYTQELVKLDELIVKDLKESKDIFSLILKGKEARNTKHPKTDVIALNAGAALYLAKKAKSILEGYSFALGHIKTGKAWEHFQNFLNCNKKRT